METAFHHHLHHHIPNLQPSKLVNQIKNVKTHLGLAMSKGFLTLRRSSSNTIITRRFQDRRLFCIKAPKETMAETAQDKNVTDNNIQSKNEGDRSPQPSPPKIPPPPEKPLPGDCCGSGCVRCVWDVYYEELEEYNKVYKKDENNKSQSKPS